MRKLSGSRPKVSVHGRTEKGIFDKRRPNTVAIAPVESSAAGRAALRTSTHGKQRTFSPLADAPLVVEEMGMSWELLHSARTDGRCVFYK
jgi:hypothetical protein